MNPHCKIGRVVPKGNIVIMPNAGASRLVVEKMRRCTEMIASFYPKDMGGFALVAWGLDGRWARAVEIRKESFIGQTLLPSFIADVLRRDTAAEVTREVLRGDA